MSSARLIDSLQMLAAARQQRLRVEPLDTQDRAGRRVDALRQVRRTVHVEGLGHRRRQRLDRAGVVAALEETRAANGMTTDAHARLMVTRGVKARPFQHPALSRSGPTMVIIMEHSRPRLPRPIRLATVPHLRGLPMTQDPKLNSHSKLNCILACIASYAQGMALLQEASRQHDYGLDLAAIARIWKGGCIIRARFLNRITEAYEGDQQPTNLMLAPFFTDILTQAQANWRKVVATLAGTAPDRASSTLSNP